MVSLQKNPLKAARAKNTIPKPSVPKFPAKPLINPVKLMKRSEISKLGRELHLLKEMKLEDKAKERLLLLYAEIRKGNVSFENTWALIKLAMIFNGYGMPARYAQLCKLARAVDVKIAQNLAGTHVVEQEILPANGTRPTPREIRLEQIKQTQHLRRVK